MKSKQDLKKVFENGDKPKQEDFWEWQDSYWHKEESIPKEKIEGIPSNLATVDITTETENIEGTVNTKEQVDEKITSAINNLKNNVPATYDTLKEIADWISNDETAEAAILQTIQNEATVRANADNLKLDKPTITSNPASYPYVVGENGNGGSARLPAGDLGKNFFNADLSNTTTRNHTMNAAITVNTLGNPHTLAGLPNKNTDVANFRKVRVQNTGGLDAVVDSKNLLIDIPSQLSDAEKTTWKTQMNGGWTTATMSIAAILPIEVSNYFNEITFITLIGNNLNLNPATFSVEILDSNNNVVANVGANSDVSNSAQLVFWFNFHNFPIGSYKIRLFNGVAYVTSSMTFEVSDRSTLRTPIDTSTLVWYDASNVSSNFRVDYQKGTTSAGITITGIVNGRENTYAVLKSSPIINTANFSNFHILIEGVGTYVVFNENIAPYANIAQIGIIKNASSIASTSDVVNYGIISQGGGNSSMSTIGVGGFSATINTKPASFKLYIIKTGNKLTYILTLGTQTSIVTEIISSDFTISALVKNTTFTSTANGVNAFNITNITGYTY